MEEHRSPLSHCAVFGVTFFGSLSFDEALPPGTVVLRHICGLVTGGTFPRKLTSGPWGSLCVPGKEVVQCSVKK
ncbi:MAG: hypothetical protein N2205_00410 [Candidatus Caldatribacterium sp.]|nr:hypothetical protein [Candidatus Caldatribacterium sp.]